MVDQLANIGCDGVTLGDRDTLLGPEVLRKLEKRAGFPFLVANLVDATTGKPFFGAHKMMDVAGEKVGIFGLTSSQTARRPWDAKPDAAMPWKVLDPIETARAEVAALKAQGAKIIVALTHLDERVETELGEQVEGITVILGGNSVKMSQHPVRAGQAYVAHGFSKGKYVSILTLNMWKGSDATAEFVDRYRKQGLEQKLVQHEARITSYQRRLETKVEAPAGKGAEVEKLRAQRKPNTDFYQQQLVKLRAEKQLMELELGDLKDPDPKANFIAYELAPLSRDMEHEESVDKAILAFREKWPKDDPKAKAKLGTIKTERSPAIQRRVSPPDESVSPRRAPSSKSAPSQR